MKLIIFQIASALLLAAVVSLCLINYIWKAPSVPNSFCHANVSYDMLYGQNNVNFTLHHRIKVFSEGSGYDNLNGKFLVDGKTYIIARTLRFNHQLVTASSSHEFKIISIHKFPSDTLPEDLSSRYLTFMQENAVRFLHLDSIDDKHILFSDTTGPSFICQYE